MNPALIVEHIREAQRIASLHGIANILQPGLVKELIIAETLGHQIIPSKADADARDAEGNLYEYLCSLCSNNNFQIDRITRDNLSRITRNTAIFCAFFSDAITLRDVYRVEPKVLLAEVERQLGNSKNQISHVNLSGAWVRKNGARMVVA